MTGERQLHRPPGAYYGRGTIWTTIASDVDDVPVPERLGDRVYRREWRFLDKDTAATFATRIGAEKPHPIADMPHQCNGWVVRDEMPLAKVTGPTATVSSQAGEAYRGKAGCQNPACTHDGNPDRCYGWHCSYCDAPANSQGDCSDADCPGKP